MQLESVRELKAALTKSVLSPLSAAGATRSIALSAQPRSEAAGVHRTVALGVARKGANDFKLAVRLQRRELEFSPELDLIRKKARGEVDVRYIGRVVKRAEGRRTPWHQKSNRPLRVGGSVGHYNITAGTLGCFVKRRSDGTVLILSNNHVLADENRGKPGDDILQPGHADGGRRPGDVIGKLESFIKLKRAGINPVDCAVATIKDGIKYNAGKLEGLGDLAGVGAAFLDEGTAVAKVGRTTGPTRGTVTAFELDNVIVGFGTQLGDLRFDNQVEVENDGETPFSLGGDSGSLIVDADRKAVGLLFAGNDFDKTYVNPIHAVLDALKVDLLY